MAAFAPDPGDVVVIAEADPVDALVRWLAAADAGVPVLVADPAAPVAAPRSLPAGAALLTTTSGSTRRPRVVCRTAASWLSSFAPFSAFSGIGPADVVALTGPPHASLHLFAAAHTLWAGATLTDDPSAATAVHAVPTVLDGLLRGGTAPGLAVLAGGVLPDGLLDRAAAAATRVVEYYGAAELSLVGVAVPPAGLRPFPGVETAVADGELWARSPYLALGYAGEHGALRSDAAGFATVGDRAEAAPDGGFRIRGRGDSAITTGGTTVLVEDIEAVLAAAPGVRAVLVTGVDHAGLGQVVAAVVEWRAEEGGSLDGLRRHARERLQPAARPRRWFVAELPRTPAGKVARSVGAERLRAGTLGETELR